MSDTIQDLYGSFSEQMEPIQADDRYFRYLYELAQASDTTLEQNQEILCKVVDERWIAMVEDSLDAITAVIENPRRFITTSQEVVPVSLAKRISADSVRHLSQNTQFLSPSDDGEVHPTRILNVTMDETYDLYENRFIYHLIQRLLVFVDKRTDVIFWSTGNEIRNRFTMHSKIGDAYEEIEYNVEMTVKNRQSFAENDADNMDVFMRIDRVRRLVMALRQASFCSLMAGCAKVRSPIQRTNLIMKDPNYRKCYQLWQFIESYDEVGYSIDVKESAMAFDDEYMVQMYTNLINNYTVFKSLLSDERNLTELEGVERETIRPKFVKEIKEEFVEDYNLPDVEIRRVFVEEVTEAQLEAEAKLAEEVALREETETQLASWKNRAGMLEVERDDLLDEVDMAKTNETMARNEAQIAQMRAAEAEDARDEAESARKTAEQGMEEARAAQADAEAKAADVVARAKEEVAATQAAAAASVAEARTNAESAIAEARATADAEIAQTRASADAAVAQAVSSAETAVAEARQDANQRIASANEHAQSEIDRIQSATDAIVLETRENSKAAVDEARESAAAAVAEAKANAEAAIAEIRTDTEQAQRRTTEEAEQKVEQMRMECEAELARIKAETQKQLDAMKLELEQETQARIAAEKYAEGTRISRYIVSKLKEQEQASKSGAAQAPKDDAE